MTFEANVKNAQPLRLPASVRRIPATVGIYYSPSFLMYEHSENIMGQHTMHFSMGEPSADHFDEVFLALFDKVQIIDSLVRTGDEVSELDGIIEPIFEQMTVADPILNMPGEQYVVTLEFSFRLITPDGEPLASWSIMGRGENELHWGGPGTTSNSAGDAARLALEDVSQQLLTGFHAVPGVDQWVSSIERK